MKAVVDTNTLVSGLLWRGNPSRILDAILDNRVELCLTEDLLAELNDVLRRPRLAKQVAQRGLDAAWSCDFIRERSQVLAAVGLLEVPAASNRYIYQRLQPQKCERFQASPGNSNAAMGFRG